MGKTKDRVVELEARVKACEEEITELRRVLVLAMRAAPATTKTESPTPFPKVNPY
jgi:hypothetical protein